MGQLKQVAKKVLEYQWAWVPFATVACLWSLTGEVSPWMAAWAMYMYAVHWFFQAVTARGLEEIERDFGRRRARRCRIAGYKAGYFDGMTCRDDRGGLDEHMAQYDEVVARFDP